MSCRNSKAVLVAVLLHSGPVELPRILGSGSPLYSSTLLSLNCQVARVCVTVTVTERAQPMHQMNLWKDLPGQRWHVLFEQELWVQKTPQILYYSRLGKGYSIQQWRWNIPRSRWPYHPQSSGVGSMQLDVPPAVRVWIIFQVLSTCSHWVFVCKGI